MRRTGLPTGTLTTIEDRFTTRNQAYLGQVGTKFEWWRGPFFLDVTVQTTVVPLADQLEADVKTSVANAVSAFLDPHTGGDEGTGWPFGRDVFVSELYAVIDRLPAVDFVTALSLVPAPATRVMRRDDGKLIGVSLERQELVRAHIGAGDVTVTAV